MDENPNETNAALIALLTEMRGEMASLREQVKAVQSGGAPVVELAPEPDLSLLSPLERSIFALRSHVPEESTAVVTLSAAMWRDLLSVVAAIQEEVVALGAGEKAVAVA